MWCPWPLYKIPSFFLQLWLQFFPKQSKIFQMFSGVFFILIFEKNWKRGAKNGTLNFIIKEYVSFIFRTGINITCEKCIREVVHLTFPPLIFFQLNSGAFCVTGQWGRVQDKKKTLTLTLTLNLLLFFIIKFVFLSWFLRLYCFYGLYAVYIRLIFYVRLYVEKFYWSFLISLQFSCPKIQLRHWLFSTILQFLLEALLHSSRRCIRIDRSFVFIVLRG